MRCWCPTRSSRRQGAVYETATDVNFRDPATQAKLQPLMGSVNAAGAAESDAAAYIAFLDAQSQVDKTKKIGTRATAWVARWW